MRSRFAGRASLLLLGLLALQFSGCEDDPATPPPTLDDLALELVTEPASPLISEAVTASVRVTGGGASSLLSGAMLSWGWTNEYTYLFDDLGRTELELQFFALGEQHVRVRVSKDGRERLLTQTIMVRGGEGDGSLEMIPVGNGAFLRGDDMSAFSLQRPQREIQLSGFALARTEVTNRTVAEVVNWVIEQGQVEVQGTPAYLSWKPVPNGEWLIVLDFSASNLLWAGTGVSVRAGYESTPATGVHWAGAATICNWLSHRAGLETCYSVTPSNPLHLYTVTCDFARNGYRLPTEAEWEKAARGGTNLDSGPNPNPARHFPWGDDELHFRIDQNLDGDPPYPQEMFGSLRANTRAPLDTHGPFDGPIFGGVLPVGCFPEGRGPYGHDDLIGNVAEWCYDWFGFGYYTESPSVDPHGPDTVLPSIDDFKSLRGDSWYGSLIPGLNAFSVEEGCSKRRWATYHFASNFLGFRVARSLTGP